MEGVDVLILGGGPAGSATALTLARQTPDLRVALVEAKPADEPDRWPLRSGEVLFAKHREELAALGIEVEGAPWVTHELTRFRIRTPDGREHRAEVPWEARLVEYARGEYDADLRERARRAGVALWDGTRATEAHTEGSRVRTVTLKGSKGERDVAARWVVDAGGRFALLPRQFGLKEVPEKENHAVVTAWVRDFPQDRDEWEIHFPPDGDTVEVSSPVPGLSRLGLGAPLRELRAAKLPAEAFFRTRAAKVPGIAERLDASGPIERTFNAAPVAYRVRPPSLQNALLVGDARGYLTPFYGDGTLLALRTGRLAGRLIADEARGGPTAADRYRREHRRLNRRDFWRAHALRPLGNPAFVSAFFRTPLWKRVLRAQTG